MPLFNRKVQDEAPKSDKRTYVAPVFNPGDVPTWQSYEYNGISVDDALSIPAVHRAVTAITTTVAQLDLTVERNGSAIDSDLAQRPDAARSLSAFLKRIATDLATTGNAYVRILRKSDNSIAPGGLSVLSPSRVRVTWDDAGNKFYEYTDWNGKSQHLTNNLPTQSGQVEHIRLGEYDGYVLGRGPIQVNGAALANMLELRTYLETFLAESRRPSGIYTIGAAVDADDLAQTKAIIMASRVAGQPDVLDNGTTYQSVMVTPEAAQLVELNRNSVLEVSRMFGVPAPILSTGIDGSSLTYQNNLTVDFQFVRYGLEQYLTAIEDALTNIFPNGQTVQFDTQAWLRASIAITGEAAKATAPQDANTTESETNVTND